MLIKEFNKNTNLEFEKDLMLLTLTRILINSKFEPKDILGKGKENELSKIRYFTWLYFHEELGYSNKLISVLFHRSQRGIIKGIRCISKYIELYDDYKQSYEKFKLHAKG